MRVVYLADNLFDAHLVKHALEEAEIPAFVFGESLLSVGLSDVVPVEPHARSLVMVEMLAGVLYVALVVARLVGLTVSRSAR